MRQFSQIENWVARYEPQLLGLLCCADGGNSDAALFGEWCYARHSIAYTKLPGYFVAFDYYVNGGFLGRADFHRALASTGIPVVPVIAILDNVASIEHDVVQRFLGGAGGSQG